WLSRDNAEHKADDPDHTDSLGRDVSKRLLDYGYAADIIKENIVLGVDLATQAMQVWKGSGFHIRNLLNAEVKVLGVGRTCKKGAKFGCHWTVILGSTED
ncbi:MAG TPA: CAP domain-containing protein, partial [Blastocatellia bacterium]|nr:CAP domain-containing protein [Blastocatellia bacterium]